MNINIIRANGNLWDLLAERFNTHHKSGKVHPDAAVNIEVGWPIFLSEIEKHAVLVGKKRLNIFDFGCGAGDFCKELINKGHRVVGMDHSKSMLCLAKQQFTDGAKLLHGNHKSDIFKDPSMLGKFDVVTSIHSLEWVEDVDKALENLSKLLVPGGLLIFGVFPKEHVRDSIKINDLFEGFDSASDPTCGYANFDGVRVPVWVRSPRQFDRILLPLGFKRILQAEPVYPEEFFYKYAWTGSKYPEMVILAYEKVTA